MSRFIQGFFRPRNPHKYKGDPTRIIYRSSWELACMMHYDRDRHIKWWQSEEFYIPYYDPTRQTMGHYYPDFLVKYIDGRTVIYEIKPYKQTVVPIIKEGKRQPLKEALLFAKNQAKWQAATKYCEQRNYTFKIITEKDIFKK